MDVVGVSKDTVMSHQKFKEKYKIPFPLLSDPDEKVCEAYGVLQEKDTYGEKVMSINRSTFVIDGEGNLLHQFNGVKVEGHIRSLRDLVSA